MGWNRPGGSLTILSFGTRSDDAAEKFHELRRADDGVGNARGDDQLLLGGFGAEIAVVRPVYSNDGKRDMVPDACCGLRRK
jgi:hypothetical protein